MIQWSKRIKGSDGRDVWVPDGITHEGFVLTGSYTRVERVMSDVYADVRRCLIWDLEKQKAVEISLGALFECESRLGVATVDARPGLSAAVDALATAEREVIEAQRVMEREDAMLGAPCKGREVEVYKGRKVPVGTRGVVIWHGAGTYGMRVGVKDAAGTVHWTSEDNVRTTPEWRERNGAGTLTVRVAQLWAEVERLRAETVRIASERTPYVALTDGPDAVADALDEFVRNGKISSRRMVEAPATLPMLPSAEDRFSALELPSEEEERFWAERSKAVARARMPGWVAEPTKQAPTVRFSLLELD